MFTPDMRYILPFISMTAAQRGSAVLTKSNIPHKIIEIESNLTRRGCAYGIELAQFYTEAAESALKRGRIRYGDLITK